MNISVYKAVKATLTFHIRSQCNSDMGAVVCVLSCN